MLCLSPCAPHRHLHHLHHRHPPARPAAAASCGNARGPGVALCLRTPTPATPEERRQRRRVARLHDASAASASAAAPALKPPATVSRPTPAAERRGRLREMRRLWWVCGVGYWVQGFRCFPWLALNFHLARGLALGPAALQLVQNAGNLPLVAKPLFGVLSDAVYIGRAHRLPYISIGGTLQLIRLFFSLLPHSAVHLLSVNFRSSCSCGSTDVGALLRILPSFMLIVMRSYAFVFILLSSL